MIDKLKIKIIGIQKIKVTDQYWTKRHGNKSMYLVEFKRNGKLGRLAVLSDVEPSVYEIIILAVLQDGNEFNLPGIALALGRSLKKIVTAINENVL